MPEGEPATIIDGTLQVPQSAVAALTSFAFTSDLDIISAAGDLSVMFEGGFQAPDRVQGTLLLDGQFAEAFEEGLGRPREMEIAVIGERSWWREPNGAWQPGFEPGGDSDDPLVSFRRYATPWFYLEALRFDSLALAVAGPVEEVSGVSAYRVRLDKQAVIDVMGQGNELKVYPDEIDEHSPIFPGRFENAEQVLPRDFSVEVWFAEEGSYPVRIVFDYSVAEGESCALCWGFERPMTLRLQMDITDPDADVEIEPPMGPAIFFRDTGGIEGLPFEADWVLGLIP